MYCMCVKCPNVFVCTHYAVLQKTEIFYIYTSITETKIVFPTFMLLVLRFNKNKLTADVADEIIFSFINNHYAIMQICNTMYLQRKKITHLYLVKPES